MTDTAARHVTISNQRGLHARASAKFCAAAAVWRSSIRVRRDDIEVGGCSIMGLLMLGAGPGTDIEILAVGPDAHDAVAALAALVHSRFGEDE